MGFNVAAVRRALRRRFSVGPALALGDKGAQQPPQPPQPQQRAALGERDGPSSMHEGRASAQESRRRVRRHGSASAEDARESPSSSSPSPTSSSSPSSRSERSESSSSDSSCSGSDCDARRARGARRGAARVRFSDKVCVTSVSAAAGEDACAAHEAQAQRQLNLEYAREAQMFKAVAAWATSESRMVKRSYDGDQLECFLATRRAEAARRKGLDSFQNLVDKVARYVDKHMYAPSPDEVDNAVVRAHTEEILTCLVADKLLALLEYDVEQSAELRDLYHNTFHVSRTISWRRQAALDAAAR